MTVGRDDKLPVICNFGHNFRHSVIVPSPPTHTPGVGGLGMIMEYKTGFNLKSIPGLRN